LGMFCASIFSSVSVKTAPGAAFGDWRCNIESHEIRHETMQHKTMQFASRSAVVNRTSSILHPVFKVLKKVSIFQRSAYHCSF